MIRETNGLGNNQSRDEWKTNSDLFTKLNLQYPFGFDCCANASNSKCNFYASIFEQITSQQVESLNVISWMNPPFSKAYKMFEHFFKIITKGVAIYRADNFETKVWQQIIFKYADWVFIPNKRINYEGLQGSSARFPSALIGIGVDPPKYVEGTVLYLKK